MYSNYSLFPKMIMHTPRRAVGLLSGLLRMAKAGAVDYRLYNGRTHELGLVSFRITPRCNLNCRMCGQRGETGTFKGEVATRENDNIVPLATYQKLVDEVAKVDPVLYVWGGEPFLYPDLIDFARYANERCSVFAVNTNGTLAEKYAEQVVRDRWTALFISLDSFEEINDSIRGKGTYQKVINSIKALTREKEKQKSILPFIGIVTTVSNQNYMYLDKMVEAMKDLKLSWHIINLGTYSNQVIGPRHQAYMKDHFGIDTCYWQGFANGYNEGIDGEAMAKVLARVQAMRPGYPIVTVPVIDPKNIGPYYSNLEMVTRDKCQCPWAGVNINYNGDVHFCADYPDWIIGNIKNEPLLPMLNNERAVKFRQELKSAQGGIFPGCARCYQNMLFGRRRA